MTLAFGHLTYKSISFMIKKIAAYAFNVYKKAMKLLPTVSIKCHEICADLLGKYCIYISVFAHSDNSGRIQNSRFVN